MKPALALPLQQHAKHATALRLLGRPVVTVTIAQAAPVVAVRQFGQLMTSRGPIWQQEVCDAQKVTLLRRSGLRLINADSDDPTVLRAAGYRRLMTPAYIAELNLTGTLTMRIAGMKPKWRNAWRTSKNVAVTKQHFDPHAHAWILQADLDQQRSKGFRGLPHALIKAYAASHPKTVQVLIAADGQMPIAAMLFVLHAPVVTYHIGWTSSRGRSLCAHHHMIVPAADCFSQDGFVRLDLGHVDTVNSPGLARFKIGCGAQVRPLGGTWLRLPGR